MQEHLEMERKVSTKDEDLVAGVLVIVRLEGQHWLGLVLAQPESLRVEREVREGMWMRMMVRMMTMMMMIVRMLTMRMMVRMLMMMMIVRMLGMRMIVFMPFNKPIK